MALALFIDGFDVSSLFQKHTADLDYTLGANGTFHGTIVDDTGGGYSPAVGQSVELVNGGITVFYGPILTTEIALLETAASGIITTFDAVDEWSSATGRVVSARTYTAQTLKAIVTDLMGLMTIYGLIVDPLMDDGPTVTVTLDVQTVGEAFEALSDLTGWEYRARPDGVVEWFDVGALVPAFTLTDADARAGIRIRETRDRHINRYWVIYGSLTVVPKSETFVGNGSTSSWLMTYPVLSSTDGLVWENGSPQPLGVYGVDPTAYTMQTTLVGGTPVQSILHRTSNAPTGMTIAVNSQVQFPQITYAEDGPDVAAFKPREGIERKTEIFDAAQAYAYAAAVVRKGVDKPREMTIETAVEFALPGDVVRLELSGFPVSSDWLITAARSSEVDEGDAGSLLFRYDCIEGPEAKASWIEFWRKSAGGASGSGGSASGVLIPAGGGTGGSGASGSAPMFLGGSSVEYVQSITPTWTPSSAVRVVLDTVARGTAGATVTARLRATAGTVQARLFNVTDGVAVGSSSVVSTSSWSDVSFPVALTTGAKSYELQVLPSLANTDVAAVGYVT